MELPFNLPPVTAAELALEEKIEAQSDLLDELEDDPSCEVEAKAALQKLAALVRSRTPEQMLRIEHERINQ